MDKDSFLTPLQQHANFARALARFGRKCEVLEVKQDDTVLAKAVMIKRRLPGIGDVGFTARGPIWRTNCPQQRRAAYQELAAKGLRLVDADAGSQDALRMAGYRQVVTPGTVAMLDIRDGAQMRSRMAGKWRNRLVKAEQHPQKVRHSQLPVDPRHWLMRVEKIQRQNRRYRALPPAFSLAYSAANPGCAHLFEITDQGEPIAAMLFLRHGKMATYQIGWTNPFGRASNAHNLILSRAAAKLAKKGVDWLDLGMVNTEDAPGLARFKIGSGAQLQPLGGSWLRLPFMGKQAA